ncbi:hypothetical protein PRIPAC_93461 [Pristionchus pacificus]|uniref:Uncharacterized protein n=1 Tax=Pristionchus pacificus TaxID=54126 RepID=A0A2A6CDL6_PRIPA|nr:hypothetical protein PRIPAC_93461 [Pristionchus pacificus]|eukprot:PDM76335.1 hypothetical protein PRIPAC_39939 [Pristionchus pacificus]
MPGLMNSQCQRYNTSGIWLRWLRLIRKIKPDFTQKKVPKAERYTIRSYVHSFKENVHFIRGSAILIHKDVKGFKYEKQCNGKKNQGYEYVAVRYKKLNLPVYCCYVENDSQHISHNAAALALEGLTRGIGAGDFNINSLLQFHKIFSNLKDCMDDTMATHQSSNAFSQPSKIDYVFVVKNIAKCPAEESSEQDGDATKKVQQLSIEERNKDFYIRVHKPLCPDLMYVEAHYPIVFDISDVPFNELKQMWRKEMNTTDHGLIKH